MQQSTLLKTTSLVALTLTLAACGGGSGPSISPSPSQPTVPTTPNTPTTPASNPGDFHTAEYEADWSLAHIQADDAYSKGFTGDGAVIGFVDFGFFLNNSEIDWAAGSEGRSQQWVDMYEAFLGVEATTTNHGHWVASIAAAKKNDHAIHGVAYDAEVIAADFFSGVDMYQETSGGITYFVSDPWGYVVRQGARVVGKSIGYDEEDFIDNPPASGDTDVDGDGVAGNEHYVTTNAATVVELGGLLVAAAGNDGDPDPMVSNIDTQDLIDQYNLTSSGGAFIVAGSVNSSGEISSFSDRAGVLQDIYLLAPGEAIAIHHPLFNSEVGVGDGTSFAAPHIVGAAALLFANWPQLTALDVRNILFATATDLGAEGVDPIYGNGVLNLDAATEPLDSLGIPIIGGTSASISNSFISFGSAFGDTLPSNLQSVMMLDGYNRDYYSDLSHQVLHARTSLPFDEILDQRRQETGGTVTFSPSLGASFSLIQDRLPVSVVPALSEFTQATYRPHLRSWQFHGITQSGKSFAVGQGRHLSAAMDSLTGMVNDNALFISGYRDHYTGTDTATYFASDIWQGKTTDRLSLGFITGANKGQDFTVRSDLNRNLPFYGIEARYTKTSKSGSISLGLNSMIERETILGSRSSFGFRLAEKTTTSTLKLSTEHIISDRWTLRTKAQTGVSAVEASNSSLFTGFNKFVSSSWSVSFTGNTIFRDGDTLGLRISQPLRVENAKVSANVADHFSLTTNAPNFSSEQVSFVPTGREITTELGYRTTAGTWGMEFNVVHRRDAGHRAGLKDTATLFRLSKLF